MNQLKLPKPGTLKVTEVIPGLWVALDIEYEVCDYFEVSDLFKRPKQENENETS